MLHLVALIGIFVLIGVAFMFLPLILIGSWDWDDMRSMLLNRAFKSFTHEGHVIPGTRPNLGARLVIQALSREDDARRALVATAIAAAEQSNLPPPG